MVSLAARPAAWLRWLVLAGIVWGQVTLITATLSDPSARNWTILISIELSGIYTLALYGLRRFWLPRLNRHGSSEPADRGGILRNAILFGIFNAALIETIVWGVQSVIGVRDVAANPNLLLDLLLTMPWYAGLIILFVPVQARRKFPLAVVLLLGALYQTGADGILGGQILPAVYGERVPLLESWGFLILIAFWQFILVYSSLVVGPALVTANVSNNEEDQANPGGLRKHLANISDGLKPLSWLLPYTIFVIVCAGLIGLVDSAFF